MDPREEERFLLDQIAGGGSNNDPGSQYEADCSQADSFLNMTGDDNDQPNSDDIGQQPMNEDYDQQPENDGEQQMVVKVYLAFKPYPSLVK